MSGKVASRQSWGERWLPNNEWVLLVILAIEVLVFGLVSDNFLTLDSAREAIRLAVTGGLVGLGMTFVIKTSGIDLSVGSIMALAAVTVGVLWERAGLSIWLAAGVGVAVGLACGLLNGALVTRLRIPPLIVTLATMSLFKGLADGITGGYKAYTGFDAGFLYLGNGFLAGVIPAQLPLFAVIAAGLWVLLHRMPFGHYVTAIGFGEPGARYAGINTRAVLLRVYALSGALAGLAAIVFIAKLGQAKSDAGTGYEMAAIAMTVLGGTAITGGRGTLHGTMLGMFVIVLLQHGLRLAGQPSSIANVAVGAVLIAAILGDRAWRARLVSPAIAETTGETGEELDMKNGQLAVLCTAIVAAALIVAYSNSQLVNAIREGSGTPVVVRSSGGPGGAQPAPAPKKQLKIGVLPKCQTDPYFVSCRQGADAAAKELGVEMIWDGPTKNDPEKQNDIIEGWITKGVNVICASVENPESIDVALKKARAAGIKVLTWDADSKPDARDFFVNQATSQGIGNALSDDLAKLCGDQGEFVIISATTTAANQNEWIKYIKERMAKAHPKMKLDEIRYSDGERDKALTETRNALNKYPNLKGVMAIAAPALPGAAEALKQANRTDIKLNGLSVPSLCRDYVHEGYIDSFTLWNTVDLGYLTVQAAQAAGSGTLKASTTGAMDFGRLKGIKVGQGNVYLGEPFTFDAKNVDQFKF